MSLRFICCPANYTEEQIMPDVGDVIQFEWRPSDTLPTGQGIALTQNGHFSGWIKSQDKPMVTNEMWKFKWRVTEIYNEFYFHRGGGMSREGYIIQTNDWRDNYVHRNKKIEDFGGSQGVEVKNEEVRDTRNQVYSETVQHYGGARIAASNKVKVETVGDRFFPETIQAYGDVQVVAIRKEEVEDTRDHSIYRRSTGCCEIM